MYIARICVNVIQACLQCGKRCAYRAAGEQNARSSHKCRVLRLTSWCDAKAKSKQHVRDTAKPKRCLQQLRAMESQKSTLFSVAFWRFSSVSFDFHTTSVARCRFSLAPKRGAFLPHVVAAGIAYSAALLTYQSGPNVQLHDHAGKRGRPGMQRFTQRKKLATVHVTSASVSLRERLLIEVLKYRRRPAKLPKSLYVCTSMRQLQRGLVLPSQQSTPWTSP